MRISDWSSDVCSSDLIARDNPQLADSVADAIVAAGRDDLLRSAMRELGQMRVGKAVLTSGAVGVEDHWLGGASQYPNVVAALFVTRLLKRRQSPVVVARNTGPGHLPNVRGQDPWDYALASSDRKSGVSGQSVSER